MILNEQIKASEVQLTGLNGEDLGDSNKGRSFAYGEGT